MQALLQREASSLPAAMAAAAPSSAATSAPAPLEAIDLMEDDEDEKEVPGTVLEVKMASPLGDYDGAESLFGSAATASDSSPAVAWCSVSNLVACSTTGSIPISQPVGGLRFCIPVSVVDPERPAEHFVIRVPADGPTENLHTLAWSPQGCPRALIAVASSGRAMVWTQPHQGGPSIGRAVNSWCCEAEWSQEAPLIAKWLHGTPVYPWPPAPPAPGKTYEERFLTKVSRSSTRWPRSSFLCVCTVFRCGSLQLRWRVWPPPAHSDAAKWHASLVIPFCKGPGGVLAADVAVTASGKLILVAVSATVPGTAVLWEVHPGEVKPGGIVVSQGPSQAWPSMAPLAAFLMGWKRAEQSQREGQKGDGGGSALGPFLVCSPLNHVNACGKGARGQGPKLRSGRIVRVALDPTSPTSALVTLVAEGGDVNSNSVGHSMNEKLLWRLERWESSRQLTIHPFFEEMASGGGSGVSAASQQSVAFKWNSVAMQEYGGWRRNRDRNSGLDQSSTKGQGSTGRPCFIADLVFSPSGELAVSLPGGEVHVLVGSMLTPLRNFLLKLESSVLAPLAFSPTSCCLGTTWCDTSGPTRTILRVLRLPVAEPSPAAWERHLADRLEWSWVTGAHWWDAVACAQSAEEEGIGTVASVLALLDADFHSQTQQAYRMHYSPMLDRVKCRALEGIEGHETRTLCLDLQARLLLDSLGRAIEAALIVPGTIMVAPWSSPPEAMPQLGQDAMAVDPPLIPMVHAYVDALLDMTSHFLTRLRRYFSLYKTIAATGAGAGPASGNSAVMANGAAAAAVAKAATAAKSGKSPGGETALAGSVPGGTPGSTANLQLSMASARSMTAVQLVGDRHFLHRLCSLACFAIVCRKRTPPPPPSGGLHGGSSLLKGASDSSQGKAAFGKGSADDRHARLGNGNGGMGYTADEVKVMFLALNELCKKTHNLPASTPPPPTQGSTPTVRLHYADGQISVPVEQLEIWMTPHMQQFPRPRGADAAGLLVRELELSPPVEDAARKPPPMAPLGMGVTRAMHVDYGESPDGAEGEGNRGVRVWPRKRRFAERNAALGLVTAAELGAYAGLLGARRDVITATWRTAPDATWHKCMSCGRQTASLAAASLAASAAEGEVGASHGVKEKWWPSWWAGACPLCGGQWARLL